MRKKKPLPGHLQEDAGVTSKPSKLATSQRQHKLHLYMLERSPWTCENNCESSQKKRSLEQVKLSSADQQENSYTPHRWYTLLCPSFTGFKRIHVKACLRNCSSTTMVSHWYFPCTLSSKEPPLSNHSFLSNNVILCVRKIQKRSLLSSLCYSYTLPAPIRDKTAYYHPVVY